MISCYIDLVGVNQILNGSCDLTTSLSGFAAVNLPTKFEVSISTHYEDIEGDRMSKMGWFGIVRVTQGLRN